MRGLLRNNFYSMGSNLLLSTLMAAFIMIFCVFLTMDDFVPMLLAGQSFIFVANSGSAFKTDVSSDWSKFEITMPVKRSDVINAKYISFIGLILLGIIFAVMTLLVRGIFFETLHINAVIFALSYGATLSIMSVSIMFPLLLKFGAGKSELLIIVAALIAAGIYISLPFIISAFSKRPTNMSDLSVSFVAVLLAIIMITISYFISLTIYKRKEL